MGIIRRERSGNYFGGSKLIVPGQGVLTFKKYNNEINKSKINKENYDDIPSPTSTPTITPTPTITSTPTITPKPTDTPTPTITPTTTNKPLPSMTPTPTPTVTKVCYCVTFSGNCRIGTDVTYLDCSGEFNTVTPPLRGSRIVCADLSFTPIFDPICVTMITHKSCEEPPCV